MNAPRRTILFLLRNLYYLRNFEAPIRLLAERGHPVTVLAGDDEPPPPEIDEQVRRLMTDFPGRVLFGDAFGRRDFRRYLAAELHSGRDILRFYTPPFRHAEKLRGRAIAKASGFARILLARDHYWEERRNRSADALLDRLDRALPPDAAIVAALKAHDPVLVVVSPLVDFRSAQIDWVRAARSLGIPTVAAIASWDNLTTKSRLQAIPDLTVVWNQAQRREAVTLHGIAAESIAVTGAQLYDDWFTRRPSTSRQAFCAALGFDPARPILLYVGSTRAISGDEPAFARRWIATVRAAADESVRSASILVRPHPMNPADFAALERAGDLAIRVHPASGAVPVTEPERVLYFDSLFHSAALVGLNTSAMIEGAILGKRSHTFREAAHEGGQQGTLHYHYLTAAGVLHEASDLESHVEGLTDAVAGRVDSSKIAAFVADFLRPHGVAKPATPFFADALEVAIVRGATAPVPDRAPLPARIALDAAAAGVGAVHLGGRAVRRLVNMIRGRGADWVPESPGLADRRPPQSRPPRQTMSER